MSSLIILLYRLLLIIDVTLFTAGFQVIQVTKKKRKKDIWRGESEKNMNEKMRERTKKQ